MIAFLLVIATTSGAHAGACPQLRDGTGDVREYWPYVGIPNEQLDVVSGDAMGNRDVVAMQTRAVALARLDPISPTGRGYTIIADIGTGKIEKGPFFGFDILLDPFGNPTYYAAVFDRGEGSPSVLWRSPAEGEVKWSHGTLSAWVPYDVFKKASITVKRGTRIRRLWVHTSRAVVDSDVASQGIIVDTGRGDVRYILGNRACFSIGR